MARASKVRILHTADIHLRKEGDARWHALEHIIQLCEDRKVDALVITGDLFDHNFDAHSLKPAITELFSDRPFRIILLPGNHDANAYGSGAYYGSSVVVMTEPGQTETVRDVNLIGFPYIKKLRDDSVADVLEQLRDSVENGKTNMLLYHGELLDLFDSSFFSRLDFGNEGARRYMPARLSWFATLGVDHVLAGHFHSRFTILQKSKTIFVYSGSPVSITKRETGVRHVGWIEAGKRPEALAVSTYHYTPKNVTLNPFDEVDPVEKVLEVVGKPKPGEEPLIRIDGLVDFYGLGMNETKFKKSIMVALEEHFGKKIQIEFMVQDISGLLQDDIFRRFHEKLFRLGKNKMLAESELLEMLRLGAQAMIEAKL